MRETELKIKGRTYRGKIYERSSNEWTLLGNGGHWFMVYDQAADLLDALLAAQQEIERLRLQLDEDIFGIEEAP